MVSGGLAQDLPVSEIFEDLAQPQPTTAVSATEPEKHHNPQTPGGVQGLGFRI